jgi:hypothetical protein
MVRAAREASRFGAKRRAPQRNGSAQPAIVTDIPARLDRLPWSRFHLLVVIALGITWILDGLEVTIVGSIGPVLQSPLTLGLTAGEIGGAASAYVTGAVIGALIFASRIGSCVRYTERGSCRVSRCGCGTSSAPTSR